MLILLFSPHTRGCSDQFFVCVLVHVVFPAYAGMFRSTGWDFRPARGFPRIRGDVPCALLEYGCAQRFSPHTRGCSADLTQQAGKMTVFPAYAGMFRPAPGLWPTRIGFPRIRGDVPTLVRESRMCFKFSPHTRGCSVAQFLFPALAEVFPAYAGMFRRWQMILGTRPGFPRIRGDVPGGYTIGAMTRTFSPHTRGCSAAMSFSSSPWLVFPAYAGMFLL